MDIIKLDTSDLWQGIYVKNDTDKSVEIDVLDGDFEYNTHTPDIKILYMNRAIQPKARLCSLIKDITGTKILTVKRVVLEDGVKNYAAINNNGEIFFLENSEGNFLTCVSERALIFRYPIYIETGHSTTLNVYLEPKSEIFLFLNLEITGNG